MDWLKLKTRLDATIDSLRPNRVNEKGIDVAIHHFTTTIQDWSEDSQKKMG